MITVPKKHSKRVSMGTPFGDKIDKNEPLQHMLEPLGFQDGPKVAASRPRLKIDLKWCPQSMILCCFLVVFHIIRETEHTPQVSMDFPVSFASTVVLESPSWDGTVFLLFQRLGGRGGELRVKTSRKAPSHFGARREI